MTMTAHSQQPVSPTVTVSLFYIDSSAITLVWLKLCSNAYKRHFDFSWVGVCCCVTKTVPCFASGTNFCWAVKVDWNSAQDMMDFLTPLAYFWQFFSTALIPAVHCQHVDSSDQILLWTTITVWKQFSGKCGVLQPMDVSTVSMSLFTQDSQFPSLTFLLFFLAFFTSMKSELPSLSLLFISPLFSRLPVTVCVSPSAVSLPTVQQRQRRVAGREPAEGWRCFLSLQSRTNW